MCFLNNSRRETRSHICCGAGTEKLCYVFAIFNLIVVFLSWLSCFCFWGFLVTQFITQGWIWQNDSQFMPSWALAYLIYAATSVAVTISGVFAVLLLQGVCKKKPKLVMAYLIFGVIVESIVTMGFTVYIGIRYLTRTRSGHNCLFLYGVLAVAVFVCVLYGLILSLVHNTYLLLLSRKRTQNIMADQMVLHM